MMGRVVEARTAHDNFVVRDEESQRYFFTVTGEVSANLCVTPGSHLHVHYSCARK